MNQPGSIERNTETPQHLKAILGTFAQLAPELHANCVSENPTIVTLDYEPVPLSMDHPEGEAEQKYKLLLDIIYDNFNLLGRSSGGHGEHGDSSHDGHHHDHGEYLINQLRNAPGHFAEMSQELLQRVFWTLKETFVPTLSPKLTSRSTQLTQPLSPAWKERHLTKAGATPVRDCRELTDENGNTVYLMPASEYSSKVEGKGLALKDQKIRDKTKKWVEEIFQTPPEEMTWHHVDEKMAAEALRGEHMYIVPILAGLKPAGFESCGLEISRVALETFQKISEEQPDQFQILKIGSGHGGEQILIYNPSAVDEVLKKYPELFSALKIPQGTRSYNVIEQVLVRYNVADVEMTPNFAKAVGLLLGYDEYSIDNFDKPKEDAVVRGKREPHSYQYNEAPLCIWGVDYIIADPETNEGYQSQLADYQRLQKEIERELGEGKTPFRILKDLSLFGKQRTTRAELTEVTKSAPEIEEQTLPSTTLFEKELTASELLKLKKQWSLFQKLKGVKTTNPLKLRVQKGLPELLAGTLVHGTKYSREKIKNLKEEGVLSGELIGIPEDSETHFCADFFKAPETVSVRDYIEWYHTLDKTHGIDGSVSKIRSKMERAFLPNKSSRTNDQIGIVIDPNVAELKNLLRMDPYTAEGGKEMEAIVSQLPYRPDSAEGQRLSAILCGIPGNFISALILPDKLAHDKDEIKFMKSVFGEDVLLFDMSGNKI